MFGTYVTSITDCSCTYSEPGRQPTGACIKILFLQLNYMQNITLKQNNPNYMYLSFLHYSLLYLRIPLLVSVVLLHESHCHFCLSFLLQSLSQLELYSQHYQNIQQSYQEQLLQHWLPIHIHIQREREREVKLRLN